MNKSKDKLVDQIGQFATIPYSVIRMADQIGVDGLAVFVYLRYRSNEHGEAFPSYDTMQRDLGLRRQRISDALKRLEELGLLECNRRFSNSTIYTLKMPSISPTGGLMDDPPLVRQVDCISPTGGLPLVRQADANKINFNKIKVNQINTSVSKNETPPMDGHPKNSILFECAQAISEVTGVNLKTNSRKIYSIARLLNPCRGEKPVGAKEIHEWFGLPDGYWYLYDWRGKEKNQRPTLGQIIEFYGSEIGRQPVQDDLILSEEKRQHLKKALKEEMERARKEENVCV